MPAQSDIEIFGAKVRPADDATANIGGPIDDSGTSSAPGMRPASTHITGSACKLRFTASAGDTGNVDIVGRVVGGAIDGETIALNGTSNVDTTKTYERYHTIMRQTPHATSVVSIKREDNNAVLGSIPATEKGVFIMFIKSASAAGAVNREEKLFVRNKAADDGVDAYVKLTADPSAVIRIGVSASKGDSATIANRLASFGVSLFDDNVTVNIPTGILGAGERCGIIVQEQLAGGNAPIKDTFTIEAGCTSIT